MAFRPIISIIILLIFKYDLFINHIQIIDHSFSYLRGLAQLACFEAYSSQIPFIRAQISVVVKLAAGVELELQIVLSSSTRSFHARLLQTFIALLQLQLIYVYVINPRPAYPLSSKESMTASSKSLSSAAQKQCSGTAKYFSPMAFLVFIEFSHVIWQDLVKVIVNLSSQSRSMLIYHVDHKIV